MKAKNILTFFLFTGLAFLTYQAVFSRHDVGIILLSIREMSPGYILAAAGASVFFVAAEGLMIWYLLRAVNGAACVMKCIKYSFIGFFFSGITPSATGGQPMQLYYMKKDGNSLADSTVVLMSVAVIYKFVLVLLGLGFLAFWMERLRSYLGNYLWLYILGLSLNVLLVILLLGVMLVPHTLLRAATGGEKLLVGLKLLKPSQDRIRKIQGFVDSYQQAVGFFCRNKGKIAAVTAFTFLQRGSLFLLTYFVYKGLGLSGTDLLTVMVLRASIYVAVDMLPLPGSQGITELMYETVFRSVFTGGLLPAAMCVTRGLDFYFPLCLSAGVVVWNMAAGKKVKGR